MTNCGKLLLVCVTSAVLASCAAGGPAYQPTAVAAAPVGRFWAPTGLANQDLLYVSNGDAEVTVYNLADSTLVGVLTGFTKPMGVCTDKSGNVYIVDYSAQIIVEYGHAGTKPIRTLNDAPDYPSACSVDPTTGNLAVANDDGTSQEGNVAIWPRAGGQPTHYTDSQLYNFAGCAYDAAGNLVVSSAVSYPYKAYFAWLPHGAAKLSNLFVPGPEPSWNWGNIFGVQWDGRYFAIDDFNIYRFSLIHGQAYYVGETLLTYNGQFPIGPYAFYMQTKGSEATEVFGGAVGDGNTSVNVWNYPAGGSQVGSITHGVDDPYAEAVSYKKKKTL